MSTDQFHLKSKIVDISAPMITIASGYINKFSSQLLTLQLVSSFYFLQERIIANNILMAAQLDSKLPRLKLDEI